MYSGIASSITDNMGKGGSNIDSINGISFDSIWSSTASDYMMESLDLSIEGFNNLMNNLGLFNEALVLTDEYKRIVEEIERLQSILVNIVGDDKEAHAARASLEAKIAALMSQKKEVRAKIEGILSSIGVVNAENVSMSYNFSGDFNELVGKMNQFNSLPMSGDLFEALTIRNENGIVVRDGEKYFNDTIHRVRAMHTGSDKTFYTTLALVDLCVEAGVRPVYKHAGTGTGGVKTNDRSLRVPVPSSSVSSGNDCNAIASFLVFNDDSTTKWLSTVEFREPTDLLVDEYSVSPGQVVTKPGHVAVLMGYNSETDQYMMYEAKGHEVGHKITLMNGAAFRSTYNVSKIDSTYVPDWL